MVCHTNDIGFLLNDEFMGCNRRNPNKRVVFCPPPPSRGMNSRYTRVEGSGTYMVESSTGCEFCASFVSVFCYRVFSDRSPYLRVLEFLKFCFSKTLSHFCGTSLVGFYITTMGMCWAPDCKHYSTRDKCHFFSFPKSGKERALWKKLLRRDVEPGPGAYVCSCHFRDGRKENGPELFLHNIAKRAYFQVESPEKKKMKKQGLPSCSSSAESLSVDIPEETVPSTMNLEEVPSTSTAVVAAPADIIQDAPLESMGVQAPLVSHAALEAEMYFLKKENAELKAKIQYLTVRFCYENVQGNDKLIVLYTGLPNSQIFEALFHLIEKLDIKYYHKWTVQKLTRIDQLFLTLVKLRLNFPQLDLAQRFGVAQSTVSNIILTFVHVIYEILYKQFMTTMPSREKNKSCLPTCFSNFTNCRAVLDCTEIFTVVSRKSMSTQKLTYSTYKHHNTFKGLIGVAPNGVITFVSDLYVGSTSDQKVVLNCGIIDMLKTGDMILADKGFLIQNILPPGVTLNIPPFLSNVQFTPEQVKCTENIARARIHVERAIRRLKCYHILNFLPESLCHYGDIVFKATAALTNLQFPLIKEVAELFQDCDD
nr:PREDICTED: uncharacterized protein LOC107398283 isoform X1 [Tribolium castaneum]|eukprot:XP_015837361.1 PREDICTED: uncharacterized protein LOC107398283 isoform X1 [Tribolium castaneum]